MRFMSEEAEKGSGEKASVLEGVAVEENTHQNTAFVTFSSW